MYSLSYTDICRFWMEVKKCRSCWEWQGALTHSGYGRFLLDGKMVRAHRVSYFLHKGDIKEKNIICHSCDNPACVNPEHLWEGTHKENTQDMIRKDRLVREKSKKNHATSQFKGVSFRKETGKWRVRKTINYKTIFIGDYESEIEAAKAFHNFQPPQYLRKIE